MKKIFIVSFVLLCGFLFAEEEQQEPSKSGTVSSTHAEYDGNALLLNGHVVLNHGLGKMNAEHANLQKQETGKEFPFSFIHLEKKVYLHLRDNAKLFCDKADLDFITLTGLLQSHEHEKVTYSDLLRKGTTFKLLGKEVELEMSRQETEEKKNTYQIETITAINDVAVHYDNDFILEANRAHYRVASADTDETASYGKVTAKPKDGELCHLHHLGDIVDASQIDLNLADETLILTNPKGRLVSSLVPHPQNSQLKFYSKELTWSQPKNTLTLIKDIHIEDSALGIVDAEDELHVVQQREEENTVIKSIRSKGSTRLEYLPLNHTSPHVLICHGSMHIDRDKLSALLLSPQKKGVTFEHKQIYFERERSASFSDRATIDYTIVDEKFTPASINLSGNVRLFSHLPNSPHRCSVADRLTYSPTTRTLILSANPGKRVLFWDEEQALRISAQEIHITEDPETKEEAIKGVGNVKFAFSQNESDLFTQIFPKFKHHESNPE